MKHTRPRSADLGGLHLATAGSGFGQGWLGYSGDMQTRFAELLTSMYTETSNVVNERDAEFAPTDLPAETRTRLIHSLDSWNFEPHKLPDEEALACTMMLFEALFRIEHMQDSLGLSLKDQIYPLIHHLRRIYRWENTYHNFEHALDVLQCTYIFLRSAGMVPSVSILLDEDPQSSWTSQRQFDSGPLMTCLGLKEIFVVYIVAIGHDVAHPGFTNLFMKNAETPLSMVYDGKSALEQMHCSLLLKVMRHYGLGPLLDDTSSGTQCVKKLLSETVLATDMSVHGAFMKNFKSLIDDDLAEPTREGRIGKEGEGQLWRRQVLLCEALMKCADISNPFRPYHVSQHWAAALMGEWTSQAMLEKCMDLPTTVQCSGDPLSEANGQVFFIDTFAKPLLELVVEAVPELQPHLDQCNDNLRLWKSRQIDLKTTTTTIATTSNPDFSSASPPSSPASSSSLRRDDYLTAFPLALPKHHPYRNVSNVDVQMHYSSIGNDDDADKNDNIIDSDMNGGRKDDGNEHEPVQMKLPTPYSSSSTATSATLFWPSSAGTKQKDPFTPTLLPAITTSLSFSSSPSTAASETASASMSSPSSPCDSISDSEYMSAAEWSSTGGESHDASSHHYTGSAYANRSIVNGRFCANGDRSGAASHHSRSRLDSSHGSTNGGAYMSALTYLPDPHAGLRAAADSARPMLRKQRSMLNRKSWGAPGEYAYARAGADSDGNEGYDSHMGLNSISSTLSIYASSLPPPPMSSPPALDHGLGRQGLDMGFGSPLANTEGPLTVLPESVSTMATPNMVKNLPQPTILVSQPHPQPREV